MRNNGKTADLTSNAHRASDRPAAASGSRPPIPAAVALTDDGRVVVRELLVTSRDVFDYLQRGEESDRVRLLTEAIESGVYCRERASQVNGLDFVRQQAQLVTSVIARLPIEDVLRSTASAAA